MKEYEHCGLEELNCRKEMKGKVIAKKHDCECDECNFWFSHNPEWISQMSFARSS